MLRSFQEHDIRATAPLDGRWDFVLDRECGGGGRPPQEYPRALYVPGAWETLPGFENYRGQAWFRTHITARPDLATRLVFGGVSHTGTVFVDGKIVGSHYDAFTPWDVVIPELEAGGHELLVAVDNTFGAHSALHIANDYLTYGGITRPVMCEHVPAVFVDKIFATPVRKGGGWNLDVRVRLRNWSEQGLKRRVVLRLGGAVLDLGAVQVRAGGAQEVQGTMQGLEVEAWTGETPKLYCLRTLLFDGAQVVDDLVDRVGFREFKVVGRAILLNGQPIRLRGFNRHEDHPQFGCAIPLEAMVTDLEIIRDLGCNFVRTCHYPNDMRFLDLCDEMGIYVWEESHARNVDFRHPKFQEQIAVSTEEMVTWHFNHPAILMWGCLNECDSATAFGKKVYERVLKQLKRLDPSRPVTFASDKGVEDRCLGLVDIVSWNRYDAWYGGSPGTSASKLEEMLEWLHSGRSRGGQNKPVILSEFGAGGIYGNRQRCRSKWSEEYQSDALDESLNVYLNHPDIVGAAIWQFCDTRVTENYDWASRPRGMNNKGTVDEYRRPKSCYGIVKARMLEAKKNWEKRLLASQKP